MPSFLDTSLSDIPDLKTAPDGEYTLNFYKAAINAKKDDPERETLKVIFEIEGVSDVLPVVQYFALPAEADDEEDRKTKGRRLKDLAKAFSVDPDEFMEMVRSAYGYYLVKADQDDAFSPLVGYSTSAILGTEEYNGDKKNVVKQLLKPRM